MKMNKMLEVKNLSVCFKDEQSNSLKAVDGLNFHLNKNEILGIVGESGSGKTLTAYSILGLLPDDAKVVSGNIIYKDTDLLRLRKNELIKYRGKEISMILQDPMISLNPVMKAGEQISEAIAAHNNLPEKVIKQNAIELLRKVGIPEPEKRYNSYPFSLSGGMCQRVMIAIAIANNPSILIADEPTTSLDVTIQASILKLLKEIKDERNEFSMILITHNLAIVKQICDRVIVMYGGKVQEESATRELFESPKHPYTMGLIESVPFGKDKSKPLPQIQGNVPDLSSMPAGCKFSDRCPKVFAKCKEEPEIKEIEKNKFVRCHLY